MERKAVPPFEVIEISKRLSWVLRRGAREAGLKMDEHGWVQVGDLASCKYFMRYGHEALLDIITRSNKQKKRYEMAFFMGVKWIRATDKVDLVASGAMTFREGSCTPPTGCSTPPIGSTSQVGGETSSRPTSSESRWSNCSNGGYDASAGRKDLGAERLGADADAWGVFESKGCKPVAIDKTSSGRDAERLGANADVWGVFESKGCKPVAIDKTSSGRDASARVPPDWTTKGYVASARAPLLSTEGWGANANGWGSFAAQGYGPFAVDWTNGGYDASARVPGWSADDWGANADNWGYFDPEGYYPVAYGQHSGAYDASAKVPGLSADTWGASAQGWGTFDPQQYSPVGIDQTNGIRDAPARPPKLSTETWLEKGLNTETPETNARGLATLNQTPQKHTEGQVSDFTPSPKQLHPSTTVWGWAPSGFGKPTSACTSAIQKKIEAALSRSE